MFQIQQVTLP